MKPIITALALAATPAFAENSTTQEVEAQSSWRAATDIYFYEDSPLYTVEPVVALSHKRNQTKRECEDTFWGYGMLKNIYEDSQNTKESVTFRYLHLETNLTNQTTGDYLVPVEYRKKDFNPDEFTQEDITHIERIENVRCILG